MIIVLITISILYFSIVISFIIGFDKIKTVKNRFIAPKHSFSIVVPFRNEAKNLHLLLKSIEQLNYNPNLYEILLINDSSEDESKLVIENFQQHFPSTNILLLDNKTKSASPKKDAINVAILKAKFEWIVTTDADCKVPVDWLQIFNQYIEDNQPIFISAPVKFKEEDSLLFHFQNLNFLSLIGSTIGSFGIKKPIMCNGANLCYKKDIFKTLNGFEGNLSVASGDDIFLLEKMVENFPTQTHFLKSDSAIIETRSENSITSFYYQQLRWASKSSSYKNNFTKFIGIVVFIMNFTISTLVIYSIFFPDFWKWLLPIFILKIIIDCILIKKTINFLNSKISLKFYLLTSILHPFFTTFIAITSIFKSYQWKGRKFNK